MDFSIRINKFLASAGLGSRRGCEALVRQGRVTLNGAVVRNLATMVVLGSDKVCVKGKPVVVRSKTYLILNKPPGVVCTRSDERGRRTVFDLLPDRYRHLFTVGRLDRDSEGLLLLTNDGDLAQALAHPRHKVPKIYRVTLKTTPTDADLEQLLRGVPIAVSDAGTRRRAVAMRVRRLHERSLEITLGQGFKRQIRQMLFAVGGHEVLRLCRVEFGPLKLSGLAQGQWRELTAQEAREVKRMARAAQITSGIADDRPPHNPLKGPPRNPPACPRQGCAQRSTGRLRLPRNFVMKGVRSP